MPADALALALPPGVGPGSYWRHEDPRGIETGAGRGVDRAIRQDWASGPIADRVADFRDLLVFRSWVAARLSGSAGAAGEGQALIIAPDYTAAAKLPAANARARAVNAIGRTGTILARALPGFEGWTPPRVFATGPSGDTAFPAIVFAVVEVLVIVAESAAVAYLAHQAAQVIDNALSRRHDFSELVAADATLLRALDLHVEREKAAGKPLPFEAAEIDALALLEKRQAAIVARKTPPISAIGGGDSGGLPWWALPVGIAAAVAAVVILRK